MSELISVIVPVYNVEKYLRKCIDSIINQTYKALEIILVDDGSPDNCGLICDEYAEKDSRVRVIHKENGGLSDARNAGLDIADGEYIMFVDSDDFVECDMCETLYTRLMKDKSDMSLCSIMCVDEGSNQIQDNLSLNVDDAVLTKSEAISKFGTHNACAYVVAWNKLYKRFLWQNIRFPIGRLHEDEFVAHKLIDKCEKISTVSKRLYNYFQRCNSIMSSNYSVRRLDAIQAYIERLQYMLKQDILAPVPYTIHLIINAMLQAYSKLDLSDVGIHKTVKSYKEMVNKFYLNILCKQIPVKTKVHLTVFTISPKIYKKLIKLSSGV